MSTINYLTVRNTIMPVMNAVTANYSTLTGSTITATSMNLTSATISLGASTNQTYNNFSNGSYAPPWITAKEALSSTNKTVQSANGLYQMIVGNATSGLYLSSDSGITWSTLTGGLPTLTGSAYWSDGAISANGQYITLSIYGGSLWMSADYGRTFALTNQPTPNIWLPLNGNTTDSMGLSVVTTPGTVPGYVTLNYPGYTAQAVNLLNTAGGTATRYIRGTCPSNPANLTISFWVNPQTIGASQCIFSAYGQAFVCFLQSTNLINFLFPSGSGQVNIVASVAFVVNTWYYITAIFQTNGTCSLYINNSLQGTVTNSGGYGSYTGTLFGLGTYDNATNFAFNGYIDDLRITNSVSAYVPIPLLQPNIWLPFENTAGDLGSYSLPPSATPTIYLPFEGNTADSMNPGTPAIATGPVTYVAANREGYTGQAIRLTNTAGGTATQYVRGNWSAVTSQTISFWFNMQTGSAAQFLCTAYYNGIVIGINTDNTVYLRLPVNSGYSTTSIVSAISTNTWYYVTAIVNIGGTCSFYLNNTLVGTYANTGFGDYSSSGSFGLGTTEQGTASNAFNGLIDDFRMYNSAIPYVPVSNTTVTGSVSYVPGVVGLNAVNLVNTASGTPVNYIKGAWDHLNNFTVSGWVNFQSITSTYQVIYSSHVRRIEFFLNPSGQLVAQMPTGTGITYTAITTTYAVSINTWYHLVMIFQINGLCSFYVNSSLIGTFTNSGGYGTIVSSGLFSLGTYDDNTNTLAFNGYIDDLRIYNAAIPYHALFPQNYRSLALSGTGQYTLASAASGWVVGSSNSSQTWSKQAVCVGTQSDFIRPNMMGLGSSGSALTTSSWTMNGVTWIASTSSVYNSTAPVSYAFDNNSSIGEWVPLSNTYTTAGNSSGKITTIEGSIGNVTGEWLQIQSSVPLIMSSYQFATGNVVARTPKTYYIVGSNNGSTWFPVQYGAAGAVTTTASFTTVPGIITVNSASTQIFGSSTITTTIYATTTNTYTYFRLICLSSYSVSNDVTSLGEWYVNFVRPLTDSRPPTHALSMNHTGQYQMVATGPAAGSIMPNLTGLVTNTWSQGGVNWTAGASTSSGGYAVYNIFSNSNTVGWLCDNNTQRYTNGATNGNAALTNIQTIGSTAGEWVQIQSSVPLVLTSFAFGIGPNPYPFTNTPKTYYIIGSNDGSTWYPLQFGNFTISAFTGASVFINMNTTGTQTLTSTMVGSVATTAYSFTTNAYTYFRLIGTSLLYTAAGGSYMELGEWYMNFSNSVSYSTNYGSTWLNTSRTVSNESVALSASGQYALSTNSVAPFARLTMDNTNVDSHGVLAPATNGTGSGAVTFPGDQYKVGTNAAYITNTAGATSSLSYLNYTVPAVLYLQNTLTMACWIYPIANPASGNPCPMGFNNGSTSPGTLFQIVSGTNYINFSVWTTTGGSVSISTTTAVTLNIWTHLVGTFSNGVVSFYVNGVLQGIANVTGSLSVSGGTNMTNLFIGAAYTTWGGYRGYVDDVRLYTSALNADEVNGLFKNPAITQTVAVSSSYLPITSYIKPVLPGITANIVDTAVSQTGQYMVAVTSSTTNNVYYSTDFGATFTALTVGSSAMVSCSISYDGSYLTATNATTTYTLNRNTRGFSVTVGNQAGLINQAQNAIAIGDKAGRTNQSANSIVLNASGNALDAVAPGFYVAPVATAASSNATSFALLGYGTDNQVTQTNLTVLSNGSVGLGTVAPNFPLDIWGGAASITSSGYTPYLRLLSVFGAAYLSVGSVFGVNTYIGLQCGVTTTSALGTPTLVVTNAGTVGIGTQNPGATLDVLGASVSNAYSDTFILNTRASDSFNGDGGNTIYSRSINLQSGDLTWTGNRNYGARIYIGGGYSVNAANNHGNIVFYTSNAERMRINSAGNVSITGTLSKGGGTFDITHPLYPDTNKRLVHSFIEGPRCDLIYRGKTTLINGTAIVDINKECTHSPECAMDDGTFEALCDNAECFLQNKTGFTRVIGVITGGILTITAESENATDTIVWMVVAERKDPFIKKWDRTNPDGYLITQYTSENNNVEQPINNTTI